ncbi:hypothetical protein Tco_1160542, partial [Tanacetum coccineum]
SLLPRSSGTLGNMVSIPSLQVWKIPERNLDVLKFPENNLEPHPLSKVPGYYVVTDIIDVPGEDDDISDDEDPLPHDLADFDVEDLINDDDGVEKVYSSKEED